MKTTIDTIIREVAELPDRTSPSDQPDMMLVTGDELRTIITNALDGAVPPDLERLVQRCINMAALLVPCDTKDILNEAALALRLCPTQDAIQTAVLAEREANAIICDERGYHGTADLIRARSAQ